MVSPVVEAVGDSDVVLVRPRRFSDQRGSFCETYNARAYASAGILERFVQDNEAHSCRVGTVRGLHFQAPPHSQAKLVRVVQGAIFDVAVDLRSSSPSFARWYSANLTANGSEQFFVPHGFAHGYCTLEAHTKVSYKVDRYYDPRAEGGVHWADPTIGIVWPISVADAFLSERDSCLPTLASMRSPF